MIRLDKYISNQTLYSRNDCRKLVTKGLVTVNGAVVRSFDTKIDELNSEVVVNGQRVGYEQFVYFIINKPKGLLSASNDKNRKTVVDLLPVEYSKRNIFPVGRLDKDTTGLLILTDDGDFAHKVISPSYNVPKTYLVSLDDKITDDVSKGFKEGVTLVDGTVLKPAELTVVGENKALVTVTEGKYHQIKRMFGVFGLGVNELHRNSIGNLCLPQDLAEGEFMAVKLDFLLKKLDFA